MIHSLHWPDTDPIIVDNHKRVMDHFGLEVKYTCEKIDHGLWMDYVLESSQGAVMFLDIDAVPGTRDIIDESLQTETFIGIAQVSNHIKPASHIYAAPAFFCIQKDVWLKLNKPTFRATPHSDVGENVSYAAEMAGIRYKTLFPRSYHRRPENERWWLHTYGEYGIGTWFEGGIFHLYQGRKPQNQELFAKVCEGIVTGKQHQIEWHKSKF